MKLKNKIYFIAGSTTDVGKTFLIEKICEKFREKKVNFDIVKPIISGFSINDSNNDSARILKALEYDLTIKNFDKISPWRFETPISPNIAANRENKKIDFTKVVSFCNEKIAESEKNNKFLFIESAGGIMSPINDDKTFLDLATSLKIPVLFITANYLGAISNTLCSLEAMKAKNIIPEIVIINNHLSENNLANLEEVRNTISNFGKIKTLSLDVFLD